MSKSSQKASSIRLRQVLFTIERICVAANQDEKNETLNEIYTIAHPFVGSCDNPHWDWREKQERLKRELEEAKI